MIKILSRGCYVLIPYVLLKTKPFFLYLTVLSVGFSETIDSVFRVRTVLDKKRIGAALIAFLFLVFSYCSDTLTVPGCNQTEQVPNYS